MDNSSLGTSFDLNSQNGVMMVLLAIRRSELSSEQKSQMRDLVFLYANGGGDASVKSELEKRLAEFGIKPVAPVPNQTIEPKEEVVTAPVSPIGSSRLAPAFAVPEYQVPSQSAPTVPESPKTEDASSKIPEVKVVPTVEIPNISVAAPVAPTPKTEVRPEPSVAPVVSPAPSAPVIPQTPFPDVDQNHLNRIREIKAAVNGKVGNPVNLVDIDNAVGREYMNALLDAMKRLSGGAGQVEPAMARLEAAFVAVEKAVSAHEVAQELKEVEAVAEEVSEAVAEPAPVTREAVKVVEQPAVSSIAQVAEPVVEQSPVIAPEVTPAVSTPAPASTSTSTSTSTPVISKPEPVVSKPVSNLVTSIREAAPIHTPDELPAPESLATSASGDPLFTKEIDDGLEQLLSDWILFNKSGLFGTGPKGREHPLYKKIAELPIPHLLTGRFEGASQEIKQSITDYMNGWRYEQGIIYEQGETFEHYLRRVIKQILDLQKKRRNA